MYFLVVRRAKPDTVYCIVSALSSINLTKGKLFEKNAVRVFVKLSLGFIMIKSA